MSAYITLNPLFDKSLNVVSSSEGINRRLTTNNMLHIFTCYVNAFYLQQIPLSGSYRTLQSFEQNKTRPLCTLGTRWSCVEMIASISSAYPWHWLSSPTRFVISEEVNDEVTCSVGTLSPSWSLGMRREVKRWDINLQERCQMVRPGCFSSLSSVSGLLLQWGFFFFVLQVSFLSVIAVVFFSYNW